ncbi:hypothetical protein KFK09_012958 [Dendrobium nobile]|uniref:Uncharacterized protein n=1 Tax=Dendrobium nobile TaxID=94219 RepID=A0A8T3BGN8_DENNO|nr:hypothetical protein KFK09_012958 [Dendrobium nobile]
MNSAAKGIVTSKKAFGGEVHCKGFNIGRPFDHSLFAPDLTPIYELCHSRKSINRALILHKRGPKQEEKKRREGISSSSNAAGTSPDHRRNIAGPPQEPRRTTAGTSPDHRRSLAGLPPELRCTTTSRPDVLFKARHSAQVPTFC